MPRPVLVRLFAGVLSLVLASLAAQASQQTISGIVLDQTQAAVPRAWVRLLDPSNQEVARTLTDDQGRFRFEGLRAAHYSIEVGLTGFETQTQIASPGTEVQVVLRVAPVRESVVVTATRTSAPMEQVGASTTVLSKDEITNRQEQTVEELLPSVPGVTVVRSGGLGALTSVFVRGGNSNYNKVLLDGIPLDQPGGDYDFSNLTLENLDRIEVVRGPQSALFGTDAMASVIQLFARRGQAEDRRPHVSLSAEGGKYKTWHARGGLFGQTRAFDYSLGWSRVSTENQGPNAFFHGTSISANLGYGLGQHTTLRLILRGELSRAGTPGQTAFGSSDRDSFFRRRDGYGGFSIRNETTSFWEQRVTYTFSRSRQVSRDLGTDPPFTPSFEGHTALFPFCDFAFDFINDSRRHHVSYQSDFRTGLLDRPLGRHIFTFAFEWDRELGSLGDRLLPEPPTRAKRDSFGGTFQDQMIWGPASLGYGVRVEDNDSFGRTVIPRGSIAYLVRKSGESFGATKLKFNFGLGVKEPTFVESFSPVPSFKGNPSLGPERARSFDSGVEQRFWRDRGKLELNWYDNRFSDQIAFQTVSETPFVGTFFNVGRSKAKGGEVLIELAPGGGLRGIGSYTYLDSQITASANPGSLTTGVGRPLLRRPRHSGSFELVWSCGGINITSTTLFIGRRADSDFAFLQPPLTSNPGYTKWDLGWSFRSPHRVTYFGVVENVLNQSYMEALGFPALKLTYRAGARLIF